MHTRHLFLLAAVGAAASFPGAAEASECDTPRDGWLVCEDFEDGALGWGPWFSQSPFVECNGCSDGVNNPSRIRLEQGEAHGGEWSLHMPAEADANFRGASLAWRSCVGEKRSGCTLQGYDQLYWRAWVKLAPDHEYVHHFMNISGTRPDAYWEGDGNAGCRPNGYRHAGTTVDFNGDHELFFYTYYPEMSCDAGGYCSGDYAQNICDGCATKEMACSDGLECCWGNHFETEPRAVLPRDQWVCLEMMMKLNTPGQADGEMAFWVDDTLGHEETAMQWRDVPELQLNKVWVQHYIDNGDADQPNRIWWDDIVISTERIGCEGAAPANNATPGNAPNNGLPANNGGVPIEPTPNNATNGGSDDGSNSGVEVHEPEPRGGACGCASSGSAPGAPLLLGLFALLFRRRRI